MADRYERYVPLPGSHLSPAAGFSRAPVAVDSTQELTVTIWLRRRPDAPAPTDPALAEPVRHRKREFISREEFAKRYGADEADIARVKQFATAKGLQPLDLDAESSAARRSILVRGSIKNLGAAFRVELHRYEPEDCRGGGDASAARSYIGREGSISVPEELAAVIKGVFGLDTRQIGEPALHTRRGRATNVLTPPEIARSYDFPAVDAAGQSLGLLEFGGGYFAADINAYFNQLGQPRPQITDVLVDDATNNPGIDERYDKEVTLDIDVAGAVAPGAKLIVYFAPHTESGWVDAVSTAVHDATNQPSILSISWGAAELQGSNTLLWTQASMMAIHELFQDAAYLGVTVLAATGDWGSSGNIGDLRAHVLFPASDPGVVACGGTESADIADFPGNERTWQRTGGGISEVFPLPMWQRTRLPFIEIPLSVNNGANKRGVPDIAGYAEPGCRFIYKLGMQGRQDYVAPGTSVTTPLYGGLIALLNGALGGAVGYLNPDLYALAGTQVFRDIADGRWNIFLGAPGYYSHCGWDACTGLGVVDGTALLQALTPPP